MLAFKVGVGVEAVLSTTCDQPDHPSAQESRTKMSYVVPGVKLFKLMLPDVT